MYCRGGSWNKNSVNIKFEYSCTAICIQCLLPVSSPCVWEFAHATASTPSCLQYWCRYQVAESHYSNASTHQQSSDAEPFLQRPSLAQKGPHLLWQRWLSEWGLTGVRFGVQQLQSLLLLLVEDPGQRRGSSGHYASRLGTKHLSCAESGRAGRSCGRGQGGGLYNSWGSHSGCVWVGMTMRRGGEVLCGDFWKTERSSCVFWTANKIPCWQKEKKLVKYYIIFCKVIFLQVLKHYTGTHLYWLKWWILKLSASFLISSKISKHLQVTASHIYGHF